MRGRKTKMSDPENNVFLRSVLRRGRGGLENTARGLAVVESESVRVRCVAAGERMFWFSIDGVFFLSRV